VTSKSLYRGQSGEQRIRKELLSLLGHRPKKKNEECRLTSIRILVADDDANWRHEVQSLLQARPEWRVICEVSDGLEAVQKGEELKPDLFLLDVGLPNLNGIEAARRIRQLSADSKIVFLSLDRRLDVVEVALSTGAQGYVDKAAAQTELLSAIDAVQRGKQFVSSTLQGYPATDISEAKSARRPNSDPSRVLLSPGIEGLIRHQGSRVGFFAAAAAAFVIAIVAVAFYGSYRHSASAELVQARRQVDQLKRENFALTASLSRLNESVAAGQSEIRDLRAQLGSVATTAENLRRNTDQARGEAERSSSRDVELLDEFRDQEKLLVAAKDEAARINELRAQDEASLAQQQLRITELSDKLRVASATLDMERQFAAAGQDLRNLIVARQLHVIDVRDTGPNGNQDKAFGRVFLTEGKSLTFYVFDLNERRLGNADRNFQVWAVPEERKNASRSLGFLQADAKVQGRWVLKVENPEIVKEINSVFVTVEPVAGAKRPSGQKMLYAYLGEANHT
jgi:DNA-binding NarL/FixJ family response regulator